MKIKLLHELIIDNDFDALFEKHSSEFADSGYEDEVDDMHRSYKQLQMDFYLEQISRTDYRIGVSRISKRLLFLIRVISDPNFTSQNCDINDYEWDKMNYHLAYKKIRVRHCIIANIIITTIIMGIIIINIISFIQNYIKLNDNTTMYFVLFSITIIILCLIIMYYITNQQSFFKMVEQQLASALEELKQEVNKIPKNCNQVSDLFSNIKEIAKQHLK